MEKNKTGKYFKYAIGEIVLVVIGILIALQINNANETKKNHIRELKYLTNIKEEIKEDLLTLEMGWFKNYSKKIKALENTREFIMGNYKPIDNVKFINDVGYGAIYSRANFTATSIIYKELISTGNLDLILDDDIRSQIIDYYETQEFIINYANSIRSEYATYSNSIKPYNPKFPNEVNILEIPRILKMIRTEEFHSLLNQEFAFAYAINRQLEYQKKMSNELHKNIEKCLNK